MEFLNDFQRMDYERKMKEMERWKNLPFDSKKAAKHSIEQLKEAIKMEKEYEEAQNIKKRNG